MRRLGISRQRKERLALLVGAAAGALVIMGLLVASVTVQNGLPGAKGSELKIEFTSVGSVNRYDDVRVAGRRVGGVAAIDHGHGHAVVRVRLSEGLEGLRESTRARIRLAGLIGAQYVELVPGRRGKPLHDGATIPLSRTSTSPDLFGALTAFDKERVKDLRAMFRSLGAGFAGRGEGANRALSTTPPLLGDADRILDSLATDRAALRRLFPAAASFVGAVEPVAGELAEGFDAQERALRPLADDPRSVAAVIRESAAIVREIPVEMPRAEPLMRETEGLTRAVTRLTEHAPRALRRSTTLLRESPAPLRATVPALKLARLAVPPSLALIRDVSPLVAPFGRSMDAALPILRQAGSRVCDYDRGLPWMRSVVSYGQPAGHAFGADNLIRVLSGGDGFMGENLGPDYQDAKYNAHDEDPAPCKVLDQVFEVSGG